MLRLHLAEPADALAVARVHVRSWQVAYRGLIDPQYLDGLRPEDRAARYDFTHADPAMPRTLLASEAGQVLGFATTMPSRDADLLNAGEIVGLYIDPDHWQRGIGRELIIAARAHLAASKFTEAILWVLAGNERAMRFYQKDGWQPDRARRTQVVQGIALDELRYSRPLP